MIFEEYGKKRDFQRTPEPRGDAAGMSKRGTASRPGAKSQGLAFVIQKHASRRLHYDLRLELDGVLLSWACPKGPSLDPSEKRLAVRVEDHPLEYGEFEGTIPDGEYGAGTVEVWDRGMWVPEEEPHAALAAGKLAFRLDGEKLRGRWALVHMRGRDTGGRQNWLLIKERDDNARHPHPAGIDGAVQAPMPERVEVELATRVQRVPDGEGWLHEIKLDGYRITCRVAGGSVRLLTRQGHDWTAKMGALARALARMDLPDVLLDGEVVVLRPDGVSDFGLLQQSLSEGRDEDLVYFVFDLLYLDGYDLRDCRLADRKDALARLLESPGTPSAVRFTDHVVGRGNTFHRQACEFDLEGAVSKRVDSSYRAGRGRDWLKVKCLERQEFVIGGYTDPSGSREGFGALLVGVHDTGGSLVYAGRVGTGFSDSTIARLSEELASMERRESPFAQLPQDSRHGEVHWVEPELVAEVRFSNWTRDGRLRQASFIGLRHDKSAGDVVAEPEESSGTADFPSKSSRPGRANARADVAGISLTNPDRVLYPEIELTKLELAKYYTQVAERMIPHLASRPVALVRCPNGHTGECFFQKQAGEGWPESVLRVPVVVDGDPVDYITVDSVHGVLYLVQLDTLEIHTWSSRADAIERPDRIVIDLDPGAHVKWSAVAAAARVVRERLGSLGLASFVKTSGGKGYHVVAPLVRRHTWGEVEEFARALAEDIVRTAPDQYTASQSKERRKGRVFIDYMRTHRGATTVAAYSTRARPGAKVSVPIWWDELKRGVRPDAFSTGDVLQRISKRGRDPWDDYNRLGQSITRAMRRELGLE